MSKVKHGMCFTRTHRSWTAMLARCRNPNIKDYHRYGGRGIMVCDRWHDFRNFLEDMGEASRRRVNRPHQHERKLRAR